jgi:GntR family transcriptional regulator
MSTPGFALPRRRSPLLGLMVEVFSDRNWRLRREQWDGGPGIVAHDAAGRPVTVDHIRVTHLDRAPEIAAALGEGPVIERSRRHLIGGQPVQLATSWYPAWDNEAAEALGRDGTGPGGAPARMTGAGLGVEWSREAVTARLARRGERHQLELPGLSVVQQVVRHGNAADGRVVEVSQMTMAPGWTLIYEIRS